MKLLYSSNSTQQSCMGVDWQCIVHSPIHVMDQRYCRLFLNVTKKLIRISYKSLSLLLSSKNSHIRIINNAKKSLDSEIVINNKTCIWRWRGIESNEYINSSRFRTYELQGTEAPPSSLQRVCCKPISDWDWWFQVLPNTSVTMPMPCITAKNNTKMGTVEKMRTSMASE